MSLYEIRLREAEQLASRDPLTGLDNRRRVEQDMEYRIARGTPFCVLMIDLNRFKLINDQYGHLSVDEVLKQSSQELRSQFRCPDVIARWGGDEFVAVLDSNLSGAEACAKRKGSSPGCGGHCRVASWRASERGRQAGRCWHVRTEEVQGAGQ